MESSGVGVVGDITDPARHRPLKLPTGRRDEIIATERSSICLRGIMFTPSASTIPEHTEGGASGT
jgi:hypothetical protein